VLSGYHEDAQRAKLLTRDEAQRIAAAEAAAVLTGTELLDQLVGAGQKRFRNIEAEPIRGLEVDH
jgi:hypothetical protein